MLKKGRIGTSCKENKSRGRYVGSENVMAVRKYETKLKIQWKSLSFQGDDLR